ncbi:hypothetical protein PEC18_09175 [Paucibacter sp. O1-1]|nr:hypothetical protein [Paucibacter sp. O1-1]MDA3826023.1 hypothetical protein [Paucibacter sp. O1-1]
MSGGGGGGGGGALMAPLFHFVTITGIGWIPVVDSEEVWNVVGQDSCAWS